MQVPQIPIVNSPNNGLVVVQPGPYPDLIAETIDGGDNRLHVFRKLSKTLKPAVLLKSWQRVCMLVAGIETIQECGQALGSVLEKEIYDRYHGNIHRDPPIIGTVKRAMDDQLDILATEKFGVKFPRDKISYAQMTCGLAAHTIWRYYKELIMDMTNKINLVYRQFLKEDLSYPDGKALFDVLEDTLRVLWHQNEELRKERASKRIDGKSPLDESDSEREHPGEGVLSLTEEQLTGRKRSSGAMLLSTKVFPGVGRFQPISFLAFLLLGPPAGEKCWHRFSLEEHVDPLPPKPRMSTSSRPNARLLSEGEDVNIEDLISPRKRVMKASKDHAAEEESEAIRIFNAETTARAQRLEELKLALTLFPDDESIKAELKQFVDTQRRTSLSSSAESNPYAPSSSLPNMFCQTVDSRGNF